MKQVVQDLASGETRLVEAPIPSAGEGMLLVRTGASLVSAGTERMLVEFAAKSLLGKARARPDLLRQTLDKARREGWLTTLEAVRRRLDQPMPLGYSAAGTVVAVGPGVQGWKVGDRAACAGGGYAVHAEYMAVPVNLAVPLPAAVSDEQGAFATVAAIALHGLRLSGAQLGERVAVIGLGLLGQLAAQMARAAGCQVFGVDLDPWRVGLARQLGFAAALRPEAEAQALALSRGQGFDSVLICADTPSSDPLELAGALARDRARVVVVGAVGLQVPRSLYYAKELTLLVSRSYGPGRYDPRYEEGGADYPVGYVRWTEGRNLGAVVELLDQGALQVDPLITHRFPLDHAAQAYRLIQEREEPFLGVLFTYPPPAAQVEPELKVIRLSSARPRREAQVRLGVLGAGNFALNVMLPAVKGLGGVDLVGVASAGGLSAAHAARRFGFVYATSDEGRVIADERINAVAVLTRHHLHARQTAALLQGGKHVYCEKPLALNREQLARVTAAMEGAQSLLMVGFNRRFAPLARRMLEFRRRLAGPLAVQYRVNAGPLPEDHWLNDPQQGGGRLIGEACHFVDFITFLVGAVPQAVSAFPLVGAAQEGEQSFVLVLEFPDGSLGTIAYLAQGDRAFGKERVEMFGGGGVAVLDDFRRLEMVHSGRRRVHQLRLRADKGHRAAWQAFVDSILAGGPPPIPYTQLIGVSLATFAAQQALHSGGRVEVATPAVA